MVNMDELSKSQGVSLFIAVVVLAGTLSLTGCVEGSLSAGTSKKDVVLNPEEYVNETVTIETYPTANTDITYSGFEYTIMTENKEGKSIFLPVKYDYFYCGQCRIEAVVESYDACKCQKRTFWIKEETNHDPTVDIPWDSYDPLRSVIPVDKCEQPPEEISYGHEVEITEYRCKPNSTRKKYYLNVTDVTALD